MNEYEEIGIVQLIDKTKLMEHNLTNRSFHISEYSISQLDKFEECALQYKFLYVDKIKRYEEGVEAFLGQRFHDVIVETVS